MYDSLGEIRGLVEKIKAHIGTEDLGPETEYASEVAEYWIERYFESRGYTYYLKAQATRSEMAKLAGSGWFRKWRVPSMVDPTRRPPMPGQDPLTGDPVAKAIRHAYIGHTLVKTPRELIEQAGWVAELGEPDAQTPPASAGELHAHLVRIAPALQTRRLFVDGERMNFFSDPLSGRLPRDPRKYSSYGYVRTEYWENAKSGEGLWVFTVFRSGRRESEEFILWDVWEKVKVLEKVAERYDEPLDHKPGEDEDREVREAVKTLHRVGEELCWVEEWEAFDEELGQD